MNKMFTAFFQKLTFQRQLDITVTLGILFLALFSSIVGSWHGNERMRNDLIEQGLHITENLAHQSALALIYASADNAAEAVNATMAFPGVVGVEIRNANGEMLLVRGDVNLVKLLEPTKHTGGLQAAAILNAECSEAWHFGAPVYSQASAESPFNEAVAPEFLGHVSVVMSKATLTRSTSSIFITNLSTSLFFALLFLLLTRFLTNRMTRPLNQLSSSMGRAKAGELGVRAVLAGPKDIADMAHAFNSMMKVLEEREAALRVAAIAFEIEEGMIVTDKDEVIIMVNRAFTKLTGYSAEEAIGKTLSMLNQDAEPYQRMRESLHRDNYWQGEIWNRRKNGEIYPEWLSITAVVGTDGEITNYVCAFLDITERKEYEEELLRSNAELEQFSYVVSHDMRQPLRVISSYLQLLEMGLVDQLDSEKRGYFNFAIDGAKRIDQMLMALLEYSRAGRMGEPPTWIDSRAVLDETLQFLKPAIAEAQARLDITGNCPRIFASHDEILRLLQNLIGNAIKYRIAGRVPEISITSEIVRNEWHLCVTDNGVGIIPDQIKQLFQVFRRLQSRETYEGTGIGLALCRKIAEHHKGRIWAESAGEGQGSKFCVVLPVLRGER
ncbi:MAG: PAS domain S-box protein [Gallionella sp.]|nr:PAS domain S-box protein [Gallionella sp.]